MSKLLRPRIIGVTGAAVLVALVAFLTVGASAPRDGDDTDVETVAAPSLEPGDAIPDATGAIVLTVSGNLGDATADPVEFDLDTIDRIGLTRFTVYEPFEKRDVTFQGVDLARLMAVIGPAPDAQTLFITALDDFTAEIEISAVEGGGIMLATHQADGSPIGFDRGGPTRLIFDDGASGADDENDWIWALSTIEVR